MNNSVSNSFLELDVDKNKILIVWPNAKREMLILNLNKLSSWIKSEVTSIGVILNKDWNFSTCINKVAKTRCFHHRESAQAKHSFINQKDAQKVIHVFVLNQPGGWGRGPRKEITLVQF